MDFSHYFLDDLEVKHINAGICFHVLACQNSLLTQFALSKFVSDCA